MAIPKKLKDFGNVLGKVFVQAAKSGYRTLENMQSEYDSAQERLNKQGIDDWDEDKLKQRMRDTGNFYEESIMRQKLSKKATDNNTDEQ